MRIFLPTIGIDPTISAVTDFKQLASSSSTRRHAIVDDPATADVILFTECHQLYDPITLSRLRRTSEFRRYPDKCFVFDQRPRAYCSMPGLYTSVPWRSLHPQYQIPWSYHGVAEHPYSAEDEPDLLFSFVGTVRSHACRPPILELTHPRGLVRQVDGHVNWQPDDDGYDGRRAFFTASLRRASFILCPRGRATSSFRFYEAMAAGRVPVVIADDWIPPLGVELSEFAIRWPERSISGLVDYLERNEPSAREMGHRAREVFEQRFAENVMFDNIGDALESLAATDPWSHFPRWGYLPDGRVVRHAAGRARKLAQSAKRRMKGLPL